MIQLWQRSPPLRWVYPIPIAAQTLVAWQTPATARISMGLGRWFGLRPGPMAPLAMEPGPRGEARRDPVDANTERVRYFDPTRRHAPTGAFEAGEYTFELVRVQVPSLAVAVLERVVTWLRVQPLTEIASPTIEYFYGPSLAPILTNGSPFPFPAINPQTGGELRAEWVVIRQRVADSGDVGRQPAFLVQGTPAELPADLVLVGPWDDGRYMWGSQYSDGNNWVTGSRCLLRLFVTIRITGEGRWRLELGGRLGGYHQRDGSLGAGLDAAIIRH
jgi:hypothetical protein